MVRTVKFGGDTDTTCSMVGGLCGALHGTSWIPQRWYANLENGDRGRDFAVKLALQLADLRLSTVPTWPTQTAQHGKRKSGCLKVAGQQCEQQRPAAQCMHVQIIAREQQSKESTFYLPTTMAVKAPEGAEMAMTAEGPDASCPSILAHSNSSEPVPSAAAAAAVDSDVQPQVSIRVIGVDGEENIRNVPATSTVGSLKKALAKEIGIDPDNLELACGADQLTDDRAFLRDLPSPVCITCVKCTMGRFERECREHGASVMQRAREAYRKKHS